MTKSVGSPSAISTVGLTVFSVIVNSNVSVQPLSESVKRTVYVPASSPLITNWSFPFAPPIPSLPAIDTNPKPEPGLGSLSLIWFNGSVFWPANNSNV